MYRAIPVHFFDIVFFCTGGLRVTFVLKLGRKNVPEGGVTSGGLVQCPQRWKAPPPGTFFWPNLAKIVQGGGPPPTPPVGGGDGLTIVYGRACDEAGSFCEGLTSKMNPA